MLTVLLILLERKQEIHESPTISIGDYNKGGVHPHRPF